MPSLICGALLIISALNLKIATSVAAMENEAKRVATRPGTRETASTPGKERNVTEALNTIAAYGIGSAGVWLVKGQAIIRTTIHVQAPIRIVGPKVRRLDSSSIRCWE